MVFVPKRPHLSIPALLLTLCTPLAEAQTEPPKPTVPVLQNPGFEAGTPRENPWDGVSRQGFLELPRELNSVFILSAAGQIRPAPMPVSVSVGDLNGDGLPDILAANPAGYMWVYFNSGTKTEPKFTNAELVPVFVSAPRLGDDAIVGFNRADRERNIFLERFRTPRIHLADISAMGKLDIWLGNYLGEIMRIPNVGSSTNPDFRQPLKLEQILIPTTEDPTRRWGNLFAPAIWDFDGDGKDDLLVGEGSYSANSIHLLKNIGSNTMPRFNDTNRHFLAFGMGREQLTPAVVDYNADGIPDLLVADSSGKIGLYSGALALSGAAAEDAKAAGEVATGKWKPGQHLPFVSYLTIDGQPGKELSFGGISTVAVGDLNGDGLFDLVVGKVNGRIAVCYNKGTASEPKLAAPVELKGTASPGIEIPAAWQIMTGIGKGNFYGYASSVTLESDPESVPQEGKKALRFAYMPNINKYITSPFRWSTTPITKTAAYGDDSFDEYAAPNRFGLRQRVENLDPTKTVSLSFRHRGNRVQNARVRLFFESWVRFSEDKVQLDSRGRVLQLQRGQQWDRYDAIQPLGVSGGWSDFKRDYRIEFPNKEIAKGLEDPRLEKRVWVTITVDFDLSPPGGNMYFDDFKLEFK